jgi:hypothetical protein
MVEILLATLGAARSFEPARTDHTRQSQSLVVKTAEDWALSHAHDRIYVTDLCRAAGVNTPSAEADGFTEPLEVGFFRLKPTQAPPLKRAQAEGFVPPFGLSSPSTRNSASSSSCWFSMYCLITSSVTFPLLQQK